MGGTVAEVLAKAACGGIFVVVFALVAHVATPKRFAGLFGASPAVALGSLGVTLVASGAAAAQNASTGMIVGAVAFLAYTLLAHPSVERFGALRGAVLALLAWFAVAVAGYAVVLR